MKKVLAVLLCVMMAVGMMACGESEKKSSSNEKKDEVKVEKKVTDVEITIPASFYETLGVELSEESLLEEEKKEEGVKYQLNEDGSVTCKMSRTVYNKKMEGFSKDIQKGIDEILTDKEAYPSIKGIEANKDYTKFTVQTTCNSKDEFTMEESMLNFSLSISVLPYWMYMENQPDNLLIDYVNEDTGDSIYVYDSSKEDTSDSDEEEKSESEMLFTINNWYVGDIWNNFVDFRDYRETGKDCTGADIDIEFAYQEFKEAYEKKNEYHDYINGLSDEFNSIKDEWNKMNEQIELIYADLEKNGVQQGAPALNLDLLNQYGTAFGDDVYALEN